MGWRGTPMQRDCSGSGSQRENLTFGNELHLGLKAYPVVVLLGACRPATMRQSSLVSAGWRVGPKDPSCGSWVLYAHACAHTALRQ